jgi:alpha 1,3-glucosidase
MFPKDPRGFEIDDQYYVGTSGLLVKPITAKDITETTVYLAEDQVRVSVHQRRHNADLSR